VGHYTASIGIYEYSFHSDLQGCSSSWSESNVTRLTTILDLLTKSIEIDSQSTLVDGVEKLLGVGIRCHMSDTLHAR
jgi:hypothetical protein